MKFSSRKVSDTATWTGLPIYDQGSQIVKNVAANLVLLINGSSSARLFRINNGAPIPVAALTSVAIDLSGNGAGQMIDTIKVDTATLTSLDVCGL